MVVERGFADGVVSTEVLRDDVAFLMNLPFGPRSGIGDGFLVGERVMVVVGISCSLARTYLNTAV